MNVVFVKRNLHELLYTNSADTLDVADGKGMIMAPNVYAALRGTNSMCLRNFVVVFCVFFFEVGRGHLPAPLENLFLFGHIQLLHSYSG